MRALLLAAGLVLAAGCTDGDDTGPVDTAPPIEFEGPTLELLSPIEGEFREGDVLDVVVRATDDQGVNEVRGWVRRVGDPTWTAVDLTAASAGAVPHEVEIPQDDDDVYVVDGGLVLDAPGVQFYIRAEDASEFETVSYLPEDGQQAPFEVDVARVGAELPFSEGFEDAAGAISIFDLGWSVHSEGFAGTAWDVSSIRSASGSWSAGHPRGVEDMPAVVDWLITPVLDLSAASEIQVTWQQWGNNTTLADHELWISTGSPDPADGDFELVAELQPPPEDAWGRSAVHDLSAWSGASAAWVAWRYEGDFADDWYIDDVSVEALAPDIVLDGFAAGEVDPGGTTTVTVDLSNATSKDASDLVLTPSVAAEAGTVDPAQALGSLAGGASTTATFDLTVDGSWPDNSYLPVTLEVSDGERTWAWERSVLVGSLSTAAVTLNPDEAGFVQGWLGVGDPGAQDPDEFLAFSEFLDPAAETTWALDVTSRAAHLPPGPGPDRWYLRLESSVGGDVAAFTIEHDDTVYEATELPAYVADEPVITWLPEPPDPVVSDQSTVPEVVEPGDRVTWALTLRNDGAATVGATTATVSSADPDVVVVDGGPFELAADGWGEGETATFEVTVDVLASQDDSRPVPFAISVVDAVEAFERDASLEVPWPVLAVTEVSIDDGDDGRLDAGETADVTAWVSNIGDLATGTFVECDASVAGGEATASLLAVDGGLGRIDPGTNERAVLTLEATAGSTGDEVLIDLVCDDGRVYELSFSVVLGEAPWIRIFPLDDAPDDAAVPSGASDPYDFDVVNGRYRSDGSTLEIVLESSTPYDPDTLFIEAWGQSPGADWTWYQLVAQSGVGTLRGYKFGFTTLSEPTVTTLSDTEVSIAIDLASMGLGADQVEMGFAAGFCGGDTYYCDQFPDAWGDPYDAGLRPELWYALDW